jgi:hypothetical protein
VAVATQTGVLLVQVKQIALDGQGAGAGVPVGVGPQGVTVVVERRVLVVGVPVNV